MSYWGKYQPPPFTSIDPGHSLSRGLICALLPTGNGYYYDPIKNRTTTRATTNTNNSSPNGVGGAFWSLSAAQALDLQGTAGGFTVAAAINVPTPPILSQGGNIFGNVNFTNESINSGWRLFLIGSGNSTLYIVSFTCYHNSGTTASSVHNSGTPALNAGFHVIAAVQHAGASSSDLYMDGAFVLNGSVAAPTASSANFACDLTPPMLHGDTVVYFWNRELIASEHLQLWYEPYAVWSPPSTNITTFFVSVPHTGGIIRAPLDALNYAADMTGGFRG